MTLGDAPNINHLWARLLVEELVRCGVRHFCLAPGSRSTPLTTAVAQHPKAEAAVHFDERGAAFMALGLGRATGQPAAWITTSGTAVANGLPAVVEASVDHVPLLLLTADRPPELRATGANQTIDQVKIFGDYVRWQFDLPAPTTAIDPAMVLTTAGQAAYRACRAPAGPVHLNCMFRKPLVPVPGERDLGAYAAGLAEWAQGETPYTRYAAPDRTPAAETVEAVAREIAGVERGLVVAGRLDTAAEAAAALALARRLGWPLLPDVTSRLRLGFDPAAPGEPRIAHFDLALTSEAFRAAAQPEAVLHLGGRSLSKRLRRHFADAWPAASVVVRDSPERLDPDHRVTRRVESGVGAFADALAAHFPEHDASAWTQTWHAADTAVAERLDAFATAADALSEPLVARLLAQRIPAEHGWMLASSMPVRDANRFAGTGGSAVPAFANRGASGIDGTLATAAGLARGRGRPATLLIGDLAALHDLNSLALLRAAPVVAVVVNNDGGGIFSFLPVARHAAEGVFEPYFGTPHGLTFAHAAAQFNLPYESPETPAAFVEAYEKACARGTSALIEVRTDRAANRALHERLERDIAAAVDETLGGGS